MIKVHSKTNLSVRREHFGWFAAGIFALALVVRLLHLWQIRTAPFFALPMGDAQIYSVWAGQIVKGDWLGDVVFYHPPLYAYFLAVIYKIFGEDVLFVRICQSVIGALSCVLLADTGRRLFSKSVGVVAGLMLALYAPAIFFDGLFHKTVLAVFFLCVALWLLSKLVAEPRRYLLWLVVGLMIGCMILTRENALVFVMGILIWLLVHHRSLGKRCLIFAVMFLLGLAVVLTPVAIRNRIVGGEFHLTTSNFGRNFYIGNNENAEGFYKPLRYGRGHPRYELADDTELAEQEMGRRLTPAEVSGYWMGRALDYITSQPGDWLRLMAKKFALLWNATEIADTEDQYSYSDWSIPLRLAGYVCHLGVIGPLSLLGIWVTWHKREKLWLLYLMLAIYLVSVLVFYVFGRYRYPMVPFLVLFASAGLVGVRHLLGTKSAPQIAGCIAAMIVMAVFCNWPMMPKDIMRAMTYSNVGGELVLRGKFDEAVSSYRRAVRAWPGYAVAHYNLGNALKSQGKLSEAIYHYYCALQAKPDYAKAHNNLGIALVAQGKLDEAIRHYRYSLQIRPDIAEAHNNLGYALEQQGKLDEAIAHYIEALRINPNFAEAHKNLGTALIQKGVLEEAITHLKEALRINPDSADAHSNLGYALVRQGNLDEAITHFKETLRVKPDWVEPMNSLAWLLATCEQTKFHNPAEAIQLAESACELTNNENPSFLDTLAASYAAAGKFPEAVTTAEKALKIAQSSLQRRLAEEIQNRLGLYKAGRPYIESSPKLSPD